MNVFSVVVVQCIEISVFVTDGRLFHSHFGFFGNAALMFTFLFHTASPDAKQTITLVRCML